MTDRICTAPGCESRLLAAGLCGKHYQRVRAYGGLARHCLGCDAELDGRGSHQFCSPACRPPCRIEGCSSPSDRAANTLCSSHFAQLLRYGEAKPFQFKWKKAGPCLTCGASSDGYRLRAFCSFSCYQLWVRYDGDVPHTKPCVSCGRPIDLMEVGKGGQRKHRVVTFCKPCGNRRTKYDGATVLSLAERDGSTCALCGEPIDMGLRRNDEGGFWCASVDHIRPQSKGGTHDPSNLQLAHLMCNLLKSDRVT